MAEGTHKPNRPNRSLWEYPPIEVLSIGKVLGALALEEFVLSPSPFGEDLVQGANRRASTGSALTPQPGEGQLEDQVETIPRMMNLFSS
jgi:hypothetical protein